MFSNNQNGDEQTQLSESKNVRVWNECVITMKSTDGETFRLLITEDDWILEDMVESVFNYSASQWTYEDEQRFLSGE